MDLLIPEFKDAAVFIVADITTTEGNAFALRNNVPNTVLLLFDGEGRRVDTIYGVQEEGELRQKFNRFLGR